MSAAILPHLPWRERAGLPELMRVLGADEGDSRFVGGAVRDSLLGLPVKDVDVATRLAPQTVLDRLRSADIKAVPTGIAHGTITAVIDHWPVEITTLRRDVATDGRRATITFSTEWREDAARRDFTMNALYADPLTGEIFDYYGGCDDLGSRQVRFIGDADLRIAEDHLRILRYFRFVARFGADTIASADLDACIRNAASLRSLSRERVADELFRLLDTSAPQRAVSMMVAGGIFAHIVPEIAADGLTRLDALTRNEAATGADHDTLRRLVALLGPDATRADAVAARLRLSNKLRKRIAAVLDSAQADSPRALAYRIGMDATRDRILLGLAFHPEAIGEIRDWTPPALPISGGDLVRRGLAAGPDIARVLKQIESRWVAEGFPGADRVAQIADQAVGGLLSPRQ